MPHLVIFAGGSGSRTINVALARSGLTVTRIVPPWDSGGSSKVIRERLAILPVGDIRHALMTMAHGEGRAGDVVRIFNTRLSDGADAATLRDELAFFIDGHHPSLKRMDPELRGAIVDYLRIFRSQAGPAFDLRRGSVGNFVLAGAYFAHGNDINAAILVFRKLCSIAGNVWPTSTDNGVQLQAELNNGDRILGQDRITALGAAQAQSGIRSVTLTGSAGNGSVTSTVASNPAVLEAVGTADAIVFGPGSFYTSVLPHMLVEGVAAAVASRKDIPKIFVGNMLECAETGGVSLNRMVEVFGTCCRRMTSGRHELVDFVTHVLANRSPTPFPRSHAGRSYVGFHDADPALAGVDVIVEDFEDPWQRGAHDASMITTFVTCLTPHAIRPPRSHEGHPAGANRC